MDKNASFQLGIVDAFEKLASTGKGALIGGAIGAAVSAKGEKKDRWKRMLGGATIGAIGGATVGRQIKGIRNDLKAEKALSAAEFREMKRRHRFNAIMADAAAEHADRMADSIKNMSKIDG